jgi:protein SCO1
MSRSSPVSAAPLQQPISLRSPLARIFAGVVAGGVVGAAAWILLSRQTPPLPVLGELPDFKLVGHDNRPFTRDSTRGHPYVADFIFTTCGGICPAMTARMLQLQGRLPAGIALVSFTVDPLHDTPEVLTRYAREFNTGPAWRFVTGERSALYRLATEGFRLVAMEVPEGERQLGGDGPFLHSSRFVLVDGAARIRGYYDSEERSALEKLLRDARRVAGGS